MGSKIQWNDQAMPKGQTLDQLLYRVRHNDADGLMFDSVTMAEIMDDSEAIEPSVTFDAIISPFGRLARKVNSLMAVMSRATPGLTVVANQVSAPFKQAGVANVVALFELGDGQTVSVYFHNPDATPGKILPTDEMISWKWLLNKKDITIVVAPERGTDLAVREVGRRIMKLASRNSAAFGRANAKRAERLQSIATLNGEIVELEGRLQSLQSQIELADIEAENDPEAIKAATSADGLAALDSFRQFLSRGQYRSIADAMRGEEGAEFIDKAQVLARLIDGMAKTYEQDGKGDQATAYLHYFKGGADWYITEKDASGKGTEQAFGSADLGQGAELGYISIDELARNNVELDLYFAPVTLASVSKAEVVPPVLQEPEAPPVGTQGDDTNAAAAVVAWGEEADVFGKTKPAFMGSSTPIPQALNVTQFGSWAFDRQSKMAYFVALDGSIVGGATAETPEAAFANMQVTPEWKALQASGKAKMLVPEGVINTVKTAKGTKVETGFTVVEAGQLIASHDINGLVNPDYPQLFQPRDRSRDSSIQWVQKTAANIDPDSLGRTQRADSGAPIVGPDRVVESGNGRTMALQEAYRSGNAEEYREWLIAEAGYFGLDAEHIKTMKAPVLVRVRTSMDIDRRMFAIEANQDDKLSLTGTEKAKADADRLDSALLNKLGDDGNLLAASNRDFVNGFLQSLGDTEAAQYMTSNGQPTGALIARIQAAIFAKAYNDDRLLELTADSSRPEVANVLEALNVSAPEFILAQAADAEGATQKLVDAWNAKGFTEERDRPGLNATAESALSVKTRRNADGEVVGQTFKIPVRAWIDGPAVAIDTQSPDMQDKFEAMAEAMGVGLDVSLSPKLAALLANVQAEASTPRGIDDNGDKIPYAKQIVFCDAIALHNKVRRLLSKRAGVPAAAIAIITGQRNNTPEQIMDIQNGFNAAGDDNKYRVIIANEKAEVGINLQKGTQAIHHLTIGWTPDSLIQRNGRGVRQGNQTQKVAIYQYDAGGTFDTAKRSLVASKADWIGSLMSKEGGESIDIKGNISNEQADALIDVIGDVDAVTRIQAAMAAKEAEARATSNRGRQRINLDTIVKQNEFLADNSTAVDWIARRTAALMAAMAASQQVRNRLGNERSSESARAKNQALLAELEVKERGIERMIAEASSFYPANYSSTQRGYVRQADSAPIDIRALVLEFLAKAKRGESRGSDLVRSIKDGRVGSLAFVVVTVEDSELVGDWHAEVSTAKSMRDQAIQTYDRQAGQVGGMPPGVAQAISDGEGEIIGDTPVVAGCFIRGKGETYGLAVVSAKSFAGYSSTCSGVWEGTERENFSLSAIVLMGEVVYPGTPEYDNCLAQAARMEDGAEREGRTMSLLSSHCPEVASFRETEVLVAYSCYGYQLPAPYYPIVVAQTEGDSELNARIQAEQAKVIQRWEGSSFVVSSTLDVQVKDPGLRQVDAMRDYAIAHGLQAKLVDLGVSGRFDLERIIKPLVQQQDIQAMLDEGGDGDQLRARVATYVQSLVPWVDLEGDVSAYLSFSIQIMIREAAAANNTPGETAAPLVSNASATDLVNVTGKTMEWKDRIKSYALKDGQKAKWNGRQECWAIRRGAWEQLVSDFPRAAEDLELKG